MRHCPVSVDHCPGSAQLWRERLRALEEGGKTADEVQSEFERALSQPLRPVPGNPNPNPKPNADPDPSPDPNRNSSPSPNPNLNPNPKP